MRVWIRATLACAALLTCAAVAAAQTQVMPILDHIHLNVPDQAKAVEWYQKNFGGSPMTEAPDRLMFGDTRLIFLKNDKGQPSTGSALDHLGFSFADLDAKMKEFEAAGVKVVTPVRDVPGLFKLGYIEDPWGTRIEVVQDSEKLGLHHVHLRGPDPAAILAFYKEKFAGDTAKLKDRLDGVRLTGVWLLVQRGEVFGLLGPNGAGKTTTIRVLATLLPAPAGHAFVFGLDVHDNPMQVRRHLGYVPQQLSADGSLSGRENIQLFARLFDVPRRVR